MVEYSEVEKIHELIRKFSPSTSMGDFGNKELMCTELLNWYKEYLIEKAVRYIKENCYGNSYLDWYDWDQCRIDVEELVYDFKKAME